MLPLQLEVCKSKSQRSYYIVYTAVSLRRKTWKLKWYAQQEVPRFETRRSPVACPPASLFCLLAVLGILGWMEFLSASQKRHVVERSCAIIPTRQLEISASIMQLWHGLLLLQGHGSKAHPHLCTSSASRFTCRWIDYKSNLHSSIFVEIMFRPIQGRWKRTATFSFKHDSFLVFVG